mgnify:CR=1 FL=1
MGFMFAGRKVVIKKASDLFAKKATAKKGTEQTRQKERGMVVGDLAEKHLKSTAVKLFH